MLPSKNSKRPSHIALASGSTKKSRQTTTTPSTGPIANEFCCYCEDTFLSLSKHLAQKRSCRVQATAHQVAQERAARALVSQRLQRPAQFDQPPSADQDYDDDPPFENQPPPLRDSDEDMELVDGLPADFVEFAEGPTMTLEEALSRPTTPDPPDDDDHLPPNNLTVDEISNANNPVRSGAGIPDPHIVEPVRIIPFPPEHRAGQPINDKIYYTPTAKWHKEWNEVHSTDTPWAPFSTKLEWDICHWAKIVCEGKNDVDALLSIPGVRRLV